VGLKGFSFSFFLHFNKVSTVNLIKKYKFYKNF